MARNNSIGSLFIDIQARTAKLEQDLGKIRGILQRTSGDVKEISRNTEMLGANGEVKFLKFATAAFGAQSAVRLLAREFRYVLENIEKIRGIDPQVLSSVVALRTNIAEMRNNIDGIIAGGLSKFADFGTALGVGAANLENYLNRGGPQGDLNADPEHTAELDIRNEAQDVGYWQKIAAVKSQVAAMSDKVRFAALKEGEQIVELREKAERYAQTAKANNIDTMQQLTYRMEGLRLEQTANEKFVSMQKQLEDAQTTVRNSLERGAKATMSNREKVNALREAVFTLRQELMALDGAQREVGGKDPMLLEKQVEKTKHLGVVQAQLNTALTKQGELYRDLGSSIAMNLETAIMKGGKLRDVLKAIGTDILQIMIRRAITAPLADLFSGALGSLFGGMIGVSPQGGSIGTPGHAMGGPLDGATLVGERGPELLVGSRGGRETIIPNEQLRSGGGGKTFFIDARGADRTGLDNLYALIRQVNGSIETRALAAVNRQQQRRAY